MAINIYQRIIADAFDSKNWKYSSKSDSNEKTIFSINFDSEILDTLRCKIYIYDNGVCDIDAIFPISCKEEHYKELALYFAKYNCRKRYGTLRLDVEDGEIRNSYTFVFNNSTTPKEFLNKFGFVKDINDSVIKDIVDICKTESGTEKRDSTLASQSVVAGKNSKHKLSL